MNKMTRVLMVSAALCGTAWSVSQAYQLTHRWSFDSDYVDAITGAEATRNGGNVSLVDGAAVLSGNGYRDGSLNLGTGILGGGDATLEIWATQNQIRNWSRIFDYIKDRANYVMVSWTQGEDLSNDLFELRWQDQKPFSSGRITSPHILGTCYYVVVTFKLNADGSTSFRLMIRDTTTGSVTDRTETVGNWNLSMLADASFYLGQSAFDGDRDAAASYHEVRVWRGILPDEQLAANAIMGPNALPLPSGDDEVTTGFSIGEGQAFTVNNAGGYAEFEGIVTLAAGAKIRFDTAAFKGTEMRFKAGGYSFTGSSILDCVELTDSANYTAALGEDGKTITVTLNPTVPVTAVWSATTAPASGEDLANPANWTCRNASGAVLEGAVPGAKTVIVIPEGTTVFTLPLGYVPHWGGVQFGLDAHPAIRGGRIAYGDRGGMGDYSWRAIGSNTYTLLDPGADPLAVIASDSLGKSQLRFDGWFYVSADQAGTWQFRQQIDDYCALAIDGDWILHVNSWNYQIFATRGLLEGWHRFSLICGDTYGGWGPLIHLDGYDINIPIAVRLPGAEGEIPFLAGGMTLGNESGTITLGTDCDWADLGPLTIRNGVTLDLNGHNLLVTDITGDHLGAAIVNSAETASTLTFIVDPETSDSVENLIIASNINKAMDVPGVATALWTGNGNDGGVASNPANWECYSSRGALLPDAVPTEATTITLQGANVNLQVPPEATLNGRLFKIGDATLTADCDWRGLTLVPNVIGTLDLSGNNLQLINLTSGGTEGAKVVNSSTTDESELRFPIDSGITGQMESKLFGNNIKVIKEGYGVLADSVLRLGDGGTVSFTQNEGNVAIGDGGDSLIGAGNGGHGIYQLNSGNLTVNNNLMIGAHSAGDFVQTGGEVVVPNNWLAIGRWGDGTGTYTLSGGTVTAVNNGINVGEDGVGKLYVRGSGVLSSRNELHVAEFGNSKGDVWVEDNGAIIAQGNFQVGCRRSGTVTQSGGTVTCDGWFAIGRYFEGIGLYTLTGGTYTSRYNPGIIAEEGEGTFDISGSGVAELPHGTSIGHQATGRGTLKVHDGGMLVTPFIRQGPGRASLAFDGGTLVASGSGATLVDYFRGLTDVAVGPGGLTFNVGDNYVYALGTPFGSRKIEGPIVKTGTGSLTLDTLPPAGTFSIREGSLVLADNTPPTLAHRWSFNGDFQDSVGGKTASSIGGSLAFNAEGSAIVLSGNGGNSTGSLNLGTGVVPTDVATIEIWATRTGIANWSRVFDYGPDGRNYIMMAWMQGGDPRYDLVEVNKDDVKTRYDNTMSEYEANRPYHISMTIRDNHDGSSSVRWARRSADSGNIERWGSTVFQNWTLSYLVSPVFYLGHSQFSGDGDALAIYDEVRIWHGVLSDEQLTANALLGPDTLPDADLRNTLPAEASEELKANNYLLHRWTFNDTNEDEIGGQDATFNGDVTYAGSKAAYLAGGGRGASWIDLGAGVVPVDDTPFTIEIWTTVFAHAAWARMFDFGSPTSGDGSGTAGTATGVFYGFRKWLYNDTAFSLFPTDVGVSEETIGGLLAENVEYHFAFVVDPDGNGGSTVSVYIYNARTGEQFAKFTKEYPNWTPSLMNPMNCWLNHSQWDDPEARAEYNEVRIWNAALSEAQLRANTAYGPDVVLPITEASTVAVRSDLACLDVTDGATIDLGGNTVNQAAVSGTGEIMNGTLNITSAIMPGGDGTAGTLTLTADTKVSGTIKLEVGDLIDAKGKLDLTDAKVEVTDIANLSGAYVFATAEKGIIGVPDASSLKLNGRDVRISYDKTQAKIIPTGMVIFVN